MIEDLSRVLDFIERFDKFIISAHETPDGDAIGGEYALYRVLKSVGKEAMILNSDPIPGKYKFLDIDRVVTAMTDGYVPPADVAERGLIVLDTNDVTNTGAIGTLVVPRVADFLLLDHHESGASREALNAVVDSDASSTCELLFRVFEEMGVSIDPQIATALYTGIIYDTGSFIYPKTSAKTFEIAHRLVSAGVVPNTIYGRVYESNSISSLRLQSRILATLELHFGDRVALQRMSKEMLLECGASFDEADAAINLPLRSESIRVSVFFKENLEGQLRCSLRSKGNIDVSEIAHACDGGGHKTAAGFRCRYPLEQSKSKVLDMLHAYFD